LSAISHDEVTDLNTLCLYLSQFIFHKTVLYQRWSPRGHGLGLEAPRGQLVMSLALSMRVVALTPSLFYIWLTFYPHWGLFTWKIWL